MCSFVDMQFDILTIFPEIIRQYCDESILGRAQESGRIRVNAIDLRAYSLDKHHSVDDTPYGGGPGMVMSVAPIFEALQKNNALSARSKTTEQSKATDGVHDEKTHVVLLSPRGRQFTQRVAEEFLKKYERMVFVCGRYEGVDQRAADYCVDEEMSVGPYVLAGGELPALLIIESVARLVPGVLGNEASLHEETFGKMEEDNSEETDALGGDRRLGSVEYPQYTRPEECNGWKVPDVLLKGHHGEIQKWRKKNSLMRKMR